MYEFRTKNIERICKSYRRTLGGFNDRQLDRIHRACKVLMRYIQLEKDYRLETENNKDYEFCKELARLLE